MFVLKIGGSVLYDEAEQINGNLISQYAKTIRNLMKDTKSKFSLVIGGGKLARKYIDVSRSFGATESYNDEIGIEAAKLNARLIISSLNDSAYPIPPNDFQEFQSIFNLTNKIIICGGFQPGQSTNAVAALISEYTSATKLINLTDVEGVYSDDPDKNPKAKLLESLTINDFSKIVGNQETRAGHYPLFDSTAIQIIKRAKIPVQFINGKNPENLLKAIKGLKIGSLITF